MFISRINRLSWAAEYDTRAHTDQRSTHHWLEYVKPARKVGNRFEHTLPKMLRAQRSRQARIAARAQSLNSRWAPTGDRPWP